jgi:hypothetical protein
MFTSQDGRKSGSKFVSRRRDAESAKKDTMSSESPKSSTMGMGQPMKGAEPMKESRTNDQGEAKFSAANANVPDNDVKENPEGVDAGAVAAEHQPASSVTVHHGKDNHIVVSRHPDGHMHMSQHKSHKEAHEAAQQLTGPANEENTDKTANADAGQGDMFGGKESDGFNMPSLS